MGWCGWPSSTIWWRWIIQSFVNVSTKCFKVMQIFYHNIVTSEWVCASYYEGAYFVQWNFPCPCCYVPATHGDICQSNHNNQCQHCQHQRQWTTSCDIWKLWKNNIKSSMEAMVIPSRITVWHFSQMLSENLLNHVEIEKQNWPLSARCLVSFFGSLVIK